MTFVTVEAAPGLSFSFRARGHERLGRELGFGGNGGGGGLGSWSRDKQAAPRWGVR